MRLIPKIFSVTLASVIVLHFMRLLLPGLNLDWAFSVLALGALAMAFILNRSGQRIFYLILIFGAVAVSFLSGQNVLTVVWNGSRELLSLFPLIVFIPMIGWILNQEKYIETMYYYMSKALKTSTSYFLSFAVLVQLTGYFMLAGAVVLINQFAETLFKGKEGKSWDYLKDSSIMKGYALTATWSVSLPSFAYVVSLVEAPLLRTQVIGLGLSFIGLGLAATDYRIYEKRKRQPLTQELNQHILQLGTGSGSIKLVVELLILFVTLFGSVLLVHEWFKIDLLVAVPIIVIVLTFLYFAYKGKLRLFGHKLASLVKGDLSRSSQETGLILSAGILIYTMRTSEVGFTIFDSIYRLTAGVPWLDFLYVLPLFIVFLSLLGISPLTSMVLLGGLLLNVPLQYPPELIVLAVAIGNGISLMVSPFTVVSVIMSGANRKPPYENSIKLNLPFAICFYLIGLIYLWLIATIIS